MLSSAWVGSKENFQLTIKIMKKIMLNENILGDITHGEL